MESPRRAEEPAKIRKIKHRRGYGKKNGRKNKIQKINLSLIGTNAAGLKSKKESFLNIINKFSPSIVTVQETKHTRAGGMKIPGYQAFDKVRSN